MAVFVPDPDDFDVEEFIDRLASDLADRYREAEDELIREIAQRLYRDVALQQELQGASAGGGLTVAQRREQNRILALLAGHRARALRELQAIAMQVAERLAARELAEQIVALAAAEGEAAAAARLGLARRLPLVEAVPGVYTTLTGTATQAVGALALSLQSRLEILNQRITRYPQDAYQHIVSQTAPNTLLGITTSLLQQQETVRRFLAAGIDAFVDRADRVWRIGSYAEMAGRTAVARAYTDASVWRMQQSGVNLGSIVGGFDACDRCAPWIGKVVSLDGSAPGPRIMQHATSGAPVTVYVHGTLNGARDAGWQHPNCRCRVVAHLAGLSTPQADFEYNAEAEKEREKQRELERAIRAAKRDLALAPDDISRRRAARALAEAQEARRDFTRLTGRGPRYYREQLHFADGRGGTPRPNPGTPPTPKAPRGGVVIEVPKSTTLGGHIAASRSAIASVHRIPLSLPTVTVRSANLGVGANGRYVPATSILELSAKGRSPRLTFAHEIGHYLDHHALGDGKRLETRVLNNPLMSKWLDAVRETPSFRALEDIRFNPDTDPRLSGWLGKYLLTPTEMWGRSYAQYIAVRSADEVMLRELLEYRSDPDPVTALRQWGDDEFEPVATAVEAILKEIGLLK